MSAMPDEFRFRHDFAFVVHDMLARHVVRGEEERLPFVEFKIDQKDKESLEEAGGGAAFWDWCEKHGYGAVLEEFSYRSLIFGLLSDMCHFLFEGLQCSEKGTLAVALSNFRKPLQDNLFLLEWLLADRTDFLTKFRSGPQELDWGRMKKTIRKNRRIDIIGRAMDKTPVGRWMSPEWLYEVRYEKVTDFGFDPYFNRALHLVTNSEGYATEKENINFIFSNEENTCDLWNHLYALLPGVLVHSLNVVRALFRSVEPDFELHDEITELWLHIGFLLAMEDAETPTDRADVVSILNGAVESAICPECGTRFQVEYAGVIAFWETGAVTCQNCNYAVELVPSRPEPATMPEASE